MSMRPVCDRCDRLIHASDRPTMPPESSSNPGKLEGDEGFLLVSTYKGKHQIVAGLEEPPEGRHTMWIQWHDKFDICTACVIDVLYEVSKRIHDGRNDAEPLRPSERANPNAKEAP